MCAECEDQDHGELFYNGRKMTIFEAECRLLNVEKLELVTHKSKLKI